MHFWHFILRNPNVVYEKINYVERAKCLMRSRKYFLFKEKLKRSLGCTKDLKRMEGIKKVKSVDIVIISNITETPNDNYCQIRLSEGSPFLQKSQN